MFLLSFTSISHLFFLRRVFFFSMPHKFATKIAQWAENDSRSHSVWVNKTLCNSAQSVFFFYFEFTWIFSGTSPEHTPNDKIKKSISFTWEFMKQPRTRVSWRHRRFCREKKKIDKKPNTENTIQMMDTQFLCVLVCVSIMEATLGFSRSLVIGFIIFRLFSQYCSWESKIKLRV